MDLKADEAGLLAAVRARDWPLAVFPAAALAAVPVPNPSEVVRAAAGTPSVAEAAALLAASGPTPAAPAVPAAPLFPPLPPARGTARPLTSPSHCPVH